MDPFLTFLVFGTNGEASELAQTGRRLAANLGIPADIVLSASRSALPPRRRESITVLVPPAFADETHAAWGIVHRLAMLRSAVTIHSLVLGRNQAATSSPAVRG